MRTAEYYGPCPSARLAALETAVDGRILLNWKTLRTIRRKRDEFYATGDAANAESYRVVAQMFKWAVQELCAARREAREALRS